MHRIHSMFFVCGLLLASLMPHSAQAVASSSTAEELEIVRIEEQAAFALANAKLDRIRSRIASISEGYQAAAIHTGAVSSSPFYGKRQHRSLKNLADEAGLATKALAELEQSIRSRRDVHDSLLPKFKESQQGADASQDAAGLAAGFESVFSGLRLQEKESKALQDRITQLTQRVERLRSGTAALAERWRAYLVQGKVSVVSGEYWTNPFPLATWLEIQKRNMPLYLKETWNGMFMLLAVAAMLFAPAFVFGLKVLKKTGRRLQSDLDMGRLKKSWGYFCGGLAMYASVRLTYPLGNDILLMLASGLFTFGILKMSHVLRKLFLKLQSHSFAYLALAFLASGLLLASDLPESYMVAAVLLMVGAVVLRQRIVMSSSTSPSFEFSDVVLGLITFATGLSAFMGYGRLGAVITLCAVIAMAVYSAGSACSEIVLRVLKEAGKIKHRISGSLIVPGIWCVAFIFGYDWLQDFFGGDVVSKVLSQKFGWAHYSMELRNIVLIAVIFYLIKHSIHALKSVIEYAGRTWTKEKRGLIPSLQALTAYSLWSLFAILALNLAGLSLTSLTVIAGGLSVGIGFGLQNIVNNFISGIILLFGRSIQQGDIIQIGDMWYTVKKINIRTTVVESFESAILMIPNSDLITSQVTNWTKNNPTLRRDIIVGVAYGSDTQKVEQVLLEVASQHPHILKDPAPAVLFSAFGSSSLDFILRVWIDHIDNSLRAASDLRFSVDAAFRKKNIEIAFPQLDVHVRSNEGFVPRSEST